MIDQKYEKYIQLYSLKPGERVPNISLLNGDYIRTKYATGETVSFVCVAVKYLFMQGFQWHIGNHTLPDFDEGISILCKKNY